MFKLGRNGTVQRLSDGAWIPDDTRNVARQEYEAWVAAGNTPQPADADPVINDTRRATIQAATTIAELKAALIQVLKL